MVEIFNLKYLKLNRYKVTIQEFWEGTKLEVFNLSLVKLNNMGNGESFKLNILKMTKYNLNNSQLTKKGT